MANGQTEDDYPRFPFERHPMLSQHDVTPESRLGERVQTVRNHFALSVDALARLTKHYDGPELRGLSATAILRYEAGQALPGARELRLLCVALEVPADWLIFGASAAAGLQPEEAELLSALRKVVARNAKEHDQQWQENVLDGFKAEARRAALEKARRRESGE